MRSAKVGFTAAALSYAAAGLTSTGKARPKEEDYELCHVQVVFRHGARTPLHVPSYLPAVSYETTLLAHPPYTVIPFRLISITGEDLPESPFEKSYQKRGALKGGCFPGQLTLVGALQTYALGMLLKKRYLENNFLSPSHHKRASEIYTRSTNIQRTIESARCVLAGLFSDGECEEEFKICVSSPNEEIMYPNYYSCAQLSALTRWAWHDPDKVPGTQEIRQSVQEDLGIPQDEKLDLVSLRDNLAAEEAHVKQSLVLSKQTKEIAEEGAMKVMEGAFVGVEALRHFSLPLAIGPFVDLLMSNMEEKCLNGDSASNVKMHLYSAHDTTLIPLLSALGIGDCSKWPSYAASVIFELFRDQPKAGDAPKYYVRLLYNGEEKLVGNCSSTMCPLDDFKKAVSHVRISTERYRKRCLEEVEESVKAMIRNM